MVTVNASRETAVETVRTTLLVRKMLLDKNLLAGIFLASHAGVFRGACIMGRDDFNIRAPLKMPVCEANDQIRQTFFQIALHR